MKPIYLACLLLLALTLCFAVLGLVLARIHKIHRRNAATFCRFATGLVLLAASAMQYGGPADLHLRQLDFWSLMVILAISCYAMLWAGIAYQLNKTGRHGFEESELLSMLYADSQHGGLPATLDKKTERR